jgi:hypothetical protein
MWEEGWKYACVDIGGLGRYGEGKGKGGGRLVRKGQGFRRRRWEGE